MRARLYTCARALVVSLCFGVALRPFFVVKVHAFGDADWWPDSVALASAAANAAAAAADAEAEAAVRALDACAGDAGSDGGQEPAAVLAAKSAATSFSARLEVEKREGAQFWLVLESYVHSGLHGIALCVKRRSGGVGALLRQPQSFTLI